MSDGDSPEPPQRPEPFELFCTRCRRTERPEPASAAGHPGSAWHTTGAGVVCPHCWTPIDDRRERRLCIQCGRDARGGEDKGEQWTRDESDDLVCPECHIAPDDSGKVQIVKELVVRWQASGAFEARHQALVVDALRRERKIVVALLRAQLERQGRRPSKEQWSEMVAAAVEAARAAWPAPIGEQGED